MRIFCPSVTPAGIRTLTVLVDFPRPEPSHTGQGSSTSNPRPRQSVQGSLIENTPPDVELRIPEPSHPGHTFGNVPGFAPVPRHALHASSDMVRIATVVPSTACSKASFTSPSMSAPRRGPRWEPRRDPLEPPPPKRLPNRSPKPPCAPPALRNRSSKPVFPSPEPLRPNRTPAPPNRLRASSYSLRFSGLERIVLASEASLKRASAVLSPGFASGWLSRAIFRKAFLISSALAFLSTPRTL